MLHPLGQATALLVSVLLFYLTRKTWLESAWKTFGQIDLPARFNLLLLLPTSIFYVPYMHRFDLVGIFCFFYYYLNKRFNPGRWNKTPWTIAMWTLFLDNVVFFIHESSSFNFSKTNFKYLDYSLLEYKSYITELTDIPFLHSKFYFPRIMGAIIIIKIIIYLEEQFVRKFLSCNNSIFKKIIDYAIHPYTQIISLGISILIFYFTREAWLEIAWKTFGPINLPGGFNILLLPTSIFYVPYMHRLDLVGIFCLFYYYLNKRFSPERWSKTPWIIAMWALFFDNFVFYVHKSSFLYFFEIPFKKFDYSFLEYKSYFTETTRVPFLDSYFYFPWCVSIVILIRISIYLGRLCLRRYLPKKIV
jgi:hypothetical protein